MPLDPFAQQVLDLIKAAGRPPFETLDPPTARGVYSASRRVLQPDPPEVASVRAQAAPGAAGPIPLRLYRGLGTKPDAALPALVYYHGGGWVVGDLDSHDGVCRALANAAGCAVVSVDYRLAPEHKFPAAVEDADLALGWIAGNAAALGLDGARIAVGGDSAGATLATVAALLARERGFPRLRFQALVYPATEMAMTHPSHREFDAGLPLTHAAMAWFRGHYLRSLEDRADWRASPLRAVDLAGLPPAYLVTAGFDPLRDEGDAYAARLAAAGVEVIHRCREGQIHGFLTMGRIIPASGEVIGEIGAALREAFA